MAGFFDGCKQPLNILVQFLDMLIAGNIREEEAAYILKSKGLFILEIFADLHSIFSNLYLQCVDSDKILSCKVFNVVKATTSKIVKDDLSTPKVEKIHDNLYLDKNKNVLVTFEDPLGGKHTQLLKEKITRKDTLDTMKEISNLPREISSNASMIIS